MRKKRTHKKNIFFRKFIFLNIFILKYLMYIGMLIYYKFHNYMIYKNCKNNKYLFIS